MDDPRAGGDNLSEVMSAGLRPMLILVVNSRSAARAEFEAGQVADSPPV